MVIGYSNGTAYESEAHEVAGQPLQSNVPQSQHFEAAKRNLNLSKQEENLYQHHLDELSYGGLKRPTGEVSSAYATTVPSEDGTKQILIPTIQDGKQLDQAGIRSSTLYPWADSGYFPSYSSPEEAQARYQEIHNYMERDTLDYLDGR